MNELNDDECYHEASEGVDLRCRACAGSNLHTYPVIKLLTTSCFCPPISDVPRISHTAVPSLSPQYRSRRIGVTVVEIPLRQKCMG